jgi:hypothetical protein
MSETKMTYGEFQAKKEEQRQVKSARVRCWSVAVSHLLFAPVASVVYGAKTGKWAPTLVATGIGVVGVPMMAVDLGLTLGIAAPVTSAAMLINQVKDDRRRQQFVGPEEADMAYFSRF